MRFSYSRELEGGQALSKNEVRDLKYHFKDIMKSGQDAEGIFSLIETVMSFWDGVGNLTGLKSIINTITGYFGEQCSADDYFDFYDVLYDTMNENGYISATVTNYTAILTATDEDGEVVFKDRIAIDKKPKVVFYYDGNKLIEA